MGSTTHPLRVQTSRRGLVVVAGLAVALAGLAACAGGESDDASTEQATDTAAAADVDETGDGLVDAAESAEAESPAAPESAPAGEGGGVGGLIVPSDAQLAIEAHARLRVEDVRRAVDQVRLAVDAAGGRVASANIIYPGDDADDDDVTAREEASASLTLLVPPDELGSVVDRLEELGELTSFDQFAEDVADQLTDLATRIENARASVDRARALLDQATSLQDLVFLEGELTRRETDLELLLASQEQLEGRVAMSTLTLEITEQSPADEPASGRGIVDALGNGWDVFLTAVLTLVVALAAAAPFLVTIALALGAFLALRRWRRAAPAHARPAADVSAEPVPPREPVSAGPGEPGNRPG